MVCSLSQASAQVDPKSSGLSHSNVALTLARSGHLGEAEVELREAVSLEPKNPAFQAQLGSILGLEGKLDPAADCLSRAVSIEPDNADYRRELAALQWQLRRFNEAEQNLQPLMQRVPRDHAAALLLGMVYEGEGKFGDAAKLLRAEMNLVSLRPERVLALVHSDYAAGNPEKARQVSSILVDKAGSPEWKDSLYAGSHLAIEANDLDTAARLLEAVPAPDRDTKRYPLELANLDYHRGNYEACESRLSALQKNAPDTKWIDGLLGKCLVEQKKYQAAFVPLRRGIESDPMDLSNYESLLVAYESTNNLNSAADLAAVAVRKLPDRAEVWSMMGSAQIAAGHFREAIESYKHALVLSPSSAEATIGLGNAQLLAGLAAEARTTYERGIAAFPDDPRLYIGYATALTRSSDSNLPDPGPRVESLLRKAVALDDSLPAAHYLLGQRLLEQGRLQDALAELQIAAKQDPQSSRTHFALQRVYRRLGRADDAAREFQLFQKYRANQDNDPMSNRPDASQ
jgi:superkiller protein 3